ncbi:MAG: hypothetical protein Faunusvirus43_6 [Faunusvirus sp.]|uniref:Uncharacterized protein n=1 Tax=Faunusvirus sp. TaxID=2487766 RepID=A0A3G5A2M2_9VIRU|nr:MAG: hypothetical protein Faunusvirus43_6 [Faunusvirus sp.]
MGAGAAKRDADPKKAQNMAELANENLANQKRAKSHLQKNLVKSDHLNALPSP